MTKKLVAGAALLVMVVAASAYFVVSTKKLEAPSGVERSDINKMSVEDGSSVINSIKEALVLGKKMQCTYSDTVDGKIVQSVVTIDGKRFQTTVETPEGKTQVVFDGETQYFWTEKDKKGFMMKQSCLEDVQKSLPENLRESASFSQTGDIEETFDDAQDVNCKPVLSADVSVPKDVVFVDQCEMLRDSMTLLKNLQ